MVGTSPRSFTAPGPASPLERARRAAARLYGRHPNVVAVSAGLKFIRQQATGEDSCIQFLVTRKQRYAPGRRGCLPRFVYGRRSDGRIDRRHRFRTDVIVVGEIQLAAKRAALACGAGDAIEATGSQGAITLLFRNKSPDDRRHYYLITCAHVVGDWQEARPANADLTSASCPDSRPFARTIVSATGRGGRIAYDVALARVDAAIGPLPDLQVAGQTGRLRGFFPRNEICPGLAVRCALPVSLAPAATISSYAMTVPVTFRGGGYDLENVYLLDVAPQAGDSGGLVYRDGLALGMVVARSDAGWAWVQPLAGAFAWLQAMSPIKIECFNQPRKERN